MKAGLLLCDRVDLEYRSTFGDYSNMFVNLFPEFDWVLYDVQAGQFPKNVDECVVYFATGSRHSVYDNLDWIIALKEFIQILREEQIYFVGFCFGHQLLAEALGGKVYPSPHGWCVGVHQFTIALPESSPQWPVWMQPITKDFNLLMMCQDQVARLPEGTLLLAGNSSCPVGMFQVGERMLGIQAHPEFSKSYNHFLIERRVKRIGTVKVAKALESLSGVLHTELIREWVLRFVRAIQ